MAEVNEKQSLNQSTTDTMANDSGQAPNQNKFGSEQAFLDKQFENMRMISIFLFPLVAFLAFRAQDIFFFFFTEASNVFVLPFQIIIWSLIFIYFNSLLLKIALFINRQGMVVVSLGILIFYASILNLCLIPVYGLAGIGLATLISLAVMFGFAVFYLIRVGIKIPFYKICEKPVIATMVVTLILRYTNTWSFPLALVSSIIGYSIILIIVTALDK